MPKYYGFSALSIHTAPAAEPVELSDIVNQLNLAGNEAYTSMLITAARESAEQYMCRALITQTWRMMLDTWPDGLSDWWEAWHAQLPDEEALYIEIPYAPLRSITSINTYDEDDVASALVVNDYFLVDTYSTPGRLVLRADATYPVDTRRGNKIEIIYSAGYGATSDSVPASIRLGIMQHVAWMYEHRGDENVGDGMRKSGASGRYDQYKVLTI